MERAEDSLRELACLDASGDLYLAPLKERLQRQLLRLGPEGYGNRGGCFAPDGSIFAVQAFPLNTDDGSGGPKLWNVQLWDPESGSHLENPRQELVCEEMRYSRDGQYVFMAVGDVLNVFNGRDWTLHATLRGHKSYVMSIASSVHLPNLVATGGADGTVRLWDISKKAELFQLRNHTQRVLSLDWSSDGSLLASGGWDKVLNLWSMPEGRLFKSFRNGGKAVSFSPSGKEIGVGSFRANLSVINIERDEATRLVGVSEHPDPVFYTPDGSRFLAASEDGNVYVFDAELRTLVASIRATAPGAARGPRGTALNPQGNILAASLGGVCHLLRFPPIPDVPKEKENLPFPH